MRNKTLSSNELLLKKPKNMGIVNIIFSSRSSVKYEPATLSTLLGRFDAHELQAFF